VGHGVRASTNPDGLGPDDRMAAAGYDGWGWGENIASGYGSPANVMDGWMNSDPHCPNIMDDGFTLIGVGCYPEGLYGNSWTETFGG
jgi:uncharacterized protein YkwD